MTVVPGPFENITGMQRSNFNLPESTLPDSYAQVLHILRTSDKEFMKENIVFDSFLRTSILHFVLAEQVKSELDLNFLINSYREAFQCRKISTMLAQKNPKVIISKAYSDVVSLRKILLKKEFIQIKKSAHKYFVEYSKLSLP